LPWSDATFDCVAADSLLEHLDDPIADLREWRRVTRPGGRLVLWSPNRWSVLPDPHCGCWGLGWLPRSWQEPYVRLRRGCDWGLSLLSASEAARMVRAAGWSSVRVEPALAPVTGSASRTYNEVRELPLVSSLLRVVGPLWQLTARRGDDR
jgi:SAM-dependent methyltransferase